MLPISVCLETTRAELVAYVFGCSFAIFLLFDKVWV